MNFLATDENICTELRRISNRLTRIAIVLETLIVASFPEDKSVAQAIYNMRSNLDVAEKLNP